jgi:protein TonB
MNEKFLRPLIFIFAAALHLLVIFFLVFDTQKLAQEEPENARVMKLTDLDEIPPPPPPEPEPEIPQVEAIAETMIETDTPPVQEVVAAGTLLTVTPIIAEPEEDDYLPAHLVSKVPVFDERAILADLVYPPIAMRSGIQGRVILELFVNRAGVVQSITILLEEPEGRGFGEAAVRVFTGRKAITPATSNNEPVSIRYRYPISFTIR